MTNAEFRQIRASLNLTQVQLAHVLGYQHSQNVANFEQVAHPRDIPRRVALLMNAYADGYRPDNWPSVK